MDWQQQSYALMKTWMEAQQQVMSNWAQTLQASPATPPTADDPMGKLMTGAMEATNDMWRRMVEEGLRMSTLGADPATREVTEKMFASQMGMMRLLQLSFQAWQALSPMLGTGDWAGQLEKQVKALRANMQAAATEGLHTGQNMNKLWQAFMDESQRNLAPWMAAFQRSPQFMGGMLTGQREDMQDFTRLYWDAYRETFGSLLQAPGLGYTREMDEKTRQSFAAWLELQHAMYDYNLMLADTWVNAFEQMMNDLASLAEQGEQVESLRDFLNRWSATADEVFKAAFRSEAYVLAQGHLVNTMMSYRARQREVSELLLRAYDLPTRSEVDEAHRRIYELRKELKSLRRELAALKPQAVPAPAEAAPRRRRKE
jgi:class III poly(R)-hydroxyalkanoic acid synthase PhaE subunit